MQGLHSKVLGFSRELQGFSQELTESIEELKRIAKAKPCVGASLFRESYEDLKQQAGTLGAEVSDLERVTLDTISLEELLGHCLAQLKDNNQRVDSLETQLQKHGYAAEFVPPTTKPSEPTQVDHEIEGGKSPSPSPKYLWNEPKRRRSYSFPGNLADDALADMRLPTVTPSPLSSVVPSINSASPSLRELQQKYGQLALTDSSPEISQPEEGPPRAAGVALLQDELISSPQEDSPPSFAPLSSIKATPTLLEAGKDIVSSTPLIGTRPNLGRQLTINTGRRMGSSGEVGSPKMGRGGNTPLGRSDIICSRLAGGEAPWDMLSLKAAINNAAPGTGEVAQAISSATFHPQAAAFTSLLHMCAKHKLWEKALEVFEAMKKFHPGIAPNTVHFSSLISACGTAGRWKEATQVFEEMKAHSVKDPMCTPNVITYSALMTACCAGGRPDKAHEAFIDMQARGVQPDHISCSTLIAGYERWGDFEKAKALFEEMRDAGLLQKGSATKIPTYLEQFNRKLQRTNPLPSSTAYSDGSGELQKSFLDLLQSKASMDDTEGRQGEPGHRAWNSFNSHGGDSPYIGAHYGTPKLTRRASAEVMSGEDESAPLRNEYSNMRTPAPTGYSENVSAPLYIPLQMQQPPLATPVGNPQQLYQAARGGRQRSQFRSTAPSPLSHSFDSSNAGGMLPAPPGFGSPLPGFQTPAPVSTPMFTADVSSRLGRRGDVQDGTGLDAAALSQQLAATPGVNMEVANQLIGAIVQQQQALVQQAMSPLPGMAADTFAPPTTTPKAANGAPQIAQISVEEYNNLPLRFSRQLSFDQMNEAVDYINAVVEGKQNTNPGDQGHGVTPQELLPLELGNQRTTALLNCLLQLKRVRLTLREGQQHCQLLVS